MDIQNSLLSAAEKQLARQAKDLETKRAILGALPDNLPTAVKMVTASAHKAMGTVWFDAASRKDVLALLDVLVPVPLVLLRDGFTTFLPRDAFDGQLRPGQKLTNVEPFLYQVNPNTKSASAHAEWWTELACGLVKVRAELPRGDYTVERIQTHSMPKEYKWEFSGIPSAECVRWWGSDTDTPPTLTLYWDGVYFSDGKASLLESQTVSFKVK